MPEHVLTTPRTARYVTLVPEGAPTTSVWMVLHGYGQLAAYAARPFERLTEAGRLVVVPEALNRFYLDDAHQRVGATWMTREHREAEIADYVRYLDTVFTEVCQHTTLDPKTVPLVTLGFSQGSETATRWLDRSPLLAARRARADRLLLWGNGLPLDLDLSAARWLSDVNLTLVVGDADQFATPDRVAALEQRLDEAAVPYQTVRYPGGHRIDPEVLLRLAETTDE